MTRATAVRSATGRRLARLASDDGGFTLAEVVVAIGVFTVMATTATYGLVTTLQLTNVTKDRVAAANLASQELERLRSENTTTQQLDSSPRTVTLHGLRFTVTPGLNPAAAVECDPGGTRQVSVVVTWNSNPPRTARYDSVLAC